MQMNIVRYVLSCSAYLPVRFYFASKMRAHSFRKSSCNEYGKQFYRGERSRDLKSGGTGLGHAICKHILELHGSAYGVENTKDGVVFYFSLNESEGDNIEHC